MYVAFARNVPRLSQMNGVDRQFCELRLSLFYANHRAANNGRSTDNVRPDGGLDRSNSGLAGHFDRSFLDTNTLFSIQLSLNAL